ncbi:MAG: porin family protein [Betaproteobacteria bacterium]
MKSANPKSTNPKRSKPHGSKPNKSNIAAVALFAVVAAGAVAPITAAAQQASPWYVTGALGQSRYDVGDVSFSGDNKGTAFNVGGGFRFTPNVAFELGYTDYGKATYDDVGVKAKNTYGAVVLGAPISEAFSVFGKLGYGSTKRSIARPDQVTTVGTGTSATIVTAMGFSDTSRKSEAMYGLGAAYAFTPRITGTVEWQRLDNTKVDAGMVGVRFGF